MEDKKMELEETESKSIIPTTNLYLLTGILFLILMATYGIIKWLLF